MRAECGRSRPGQRRSWTSLGEVSLEGFPRSCRDAVERAHRHRGRCVRNFAGRGNVAAGLVARSIGRFRRLHPSRIVSDRAWQHIANRAGLGQSATSALRVEVQRIRRRRRGRGIEGSSSNPPRVARGKLAARPATVCWVVGWTMLAEVATKFSSLVTEPSRRRGSSLATKALSWSSRSFSSFEDGFAARASWYSLRASSQRFSVVKTNATLAWADASSLPPF